MNSYFIQWIIHHSLLSFLFWYSYCPRFDLWEPLQTGFGILFTCPVIVWVHPYTRGKIRDVLGSFGNHTAPRESKTSLTLVHLKAKIWGLGVLIVIGISWLCRPQQAAQGNIVYNHIHVQTHTHTYNHMSISQTRSTHQFQSLFSPSTTPCLHISFPIMINLVLIIIRILMYLLNSSIWH